MPWISAAISVGGSLLGGAMSSGAANNAANGMMGASDAAIQENRRQYDQTRADFAPFRDSGVAANGRLRQLLGLDSGYTGNDSGSLVKKFGADDLANDPVYNSGLEFGLNQGRDAINSRAIASGSYDSGATLKALTRYGNDYGSTKAGDAYNRFNTTNDSIYNKLAGVSGAGQQATGQVASTGSSLAQSNANLLTGAGNASAAGIVGGANAWGGAIKGVNSALSNYGQNSSLQSLLAGQSLSNQYGYGNVYGVGGGGTSPSYWNGEN